MCLKKWRALGQDEPVHHRSICIKAAPSEGLRVDSFRFRLGRSS